FAALGYLALLLALPVGFVFYRAFEHGVATAWDSVTTPAAQHAFWLTVEMVAIAVPLNTIFGILCGLVLVRQRFRGRALLNAAIRWGVAYGVVLTTARALGEFGAISIVSGKLVGQTETLTLHVENRFQAFDLTGAYAAAVVLALMAIGTLLAINVFKPKDGSG